MNVVKNNLVNVYENQFVSFVTYSFENELGIDLKKEFEILYESFFECYFEKNSLNVVLKKLFDLQFEALSDSNIEHYAVSDFENVFEDLIFSSNKSYFEHFDLIGTFPKVISIHFVWNLQPSRFDPSTHLEETCQQISTYLQWKIELISQPKYYFCHFCYLWNMIF